MGVLLNLWLHAPSPLRLRIYNVLISIGLQLYGPTGSSRCYRLPFNLYVKRGVTVSTSEANAMRYIRERTTIPIPSVIDAIDTPDGAFILMTRVVGEPVRARLQTMSTTERSLLASDLKNCFNQLRSLPAPHSGPRICGVGGGPFLCYRVEADPIGPFPTEPDFYRYLYDRSYLKEQEHLKEFGRKVHTVAHRICLTHNDLSPHNVLLHSNGRLAAILDWEGAAWLPEYWEYTTACFSRDPYHEWVQLMGDVFGPWAEELEVEREMWKYNDPL